MVLSLMYAQYFQKHWYFPINIFHLFFFQRVIKKVEVGCVLSHHIISFLFFLFVGCKQGPGCQALEATASGSLAGPAEAWLSASELCLGLLHGLATDGLSGLPRASGRQSWLSFAAEDLTHFYSFVKKGPSKCFMKPALENMQGAGFAFEKAEVSVCVSGRRGIGKVGLHVSMRLFTGFYSKETGKRPIPCSRLSLPQDEAVETEIGASSDLLRSVKPPISFVFSRSQTWRR